MRASLSDQRSDGFFPLLYAGGREAVVHEQQAMYDALTGLPNRKLFQDRAEQALRPAQRDGTGGAVLLTDLDGFKQVNDSLGHQAGDELLQAVSQRLLETTRASDTVARLGGDEFALLLPSQVDPATSAAKVAREVTAALEIPFEVPSGVCRIGGSVGVACFADDERDVEELLAIADRGMYEDKHARRAVR